MPRLARRLAILGRVAGRRLAAVVDAVDPICGSVKPAQIDGDAAAMISSAARPRIATRAIAVGPARRNGHVRPSAQDLADQPGARRTRTHFQKEADSVVHRRAR